MATGIDEMICRLEGRSLALQAINGLILNTISTDLEARLHLRDVISHLMDGVDFTALSDYSMAQQSYLAEGFFGCLNDVSGKIVTR